MGDGAAAAGGATPKASSGPPPPVVTTLWKTTHYLDGMFKQMGKKKDELFTWEQAQGVLAAYIKKEGLGNGSPGTVKLNEGLITAIIKAAGGQKKDETFPEEMDLEELEEKMQER